jgi:peptidoglycan/xylan/chitin deacetylase (PgdA/CDA1 family)
MSLPVIAAADSAIGHGAAHENFEAGFKNLIAGGNAAAVRERYLERLLKVRYRTELYLEAFETDVRKGVPLSEMESYEKLLAIHPVRDTADAEATFIYRRALETAWSGTAPAADLKVCQSVLKEIFDWIQERPEEDRLIISDWIDEIEQMAQPEAANDKSAKGRKIASTVPSFNFTEYNFGHQDNLSQMFKKHKEEIRQNARATLHWKDKELEDTIASYKFSRVPHSREVASLATSAAAAIMSAPPAAAPDAAPSEAAPPVAAPPVSVPPVSAPPTAHNLPSTAPAAPDAATKPAQTPMIYRPSIGKDGSFDGEHMYSQNFAFTFDDGPHPQNTDRVIDIATNYSDNINPHGVPLTFFWLELWAPKYPQQIARAKSLGFVMNNHSWTHLDFSKKEAPPHFYHEVVEANAALKAQFGVQPVLKSDAFPFYRCPYGACIYAHHYAGVPEVRKMIADLGLIHVLWNVDSTDWANVKNPERTRDITIAQLEKTENGVTAIGHGVILMHDIKPRSPDAFRMILDWIKKKNESGAHITLVPVTTAIAQANGTVARSMR